MIKLEGDSIRFHIFDASIKYWFQNVARRPGDSQTMDFIKHAKEAATVIVVKNFSQDFLDEVLTFLTVSGCTLRSLFSLNTTLDEDALAKILIAHK